jgi:hypothetical protein
LKFEILLLKFLNNRKTEKWSPTYKHEKVKKLWKWKPPALGELANETTDEKPEA